MYDTTPAAEAIVSRVADRLTNAERVRMRASLEIDLHMGGTHAINRAVRNLDRQRLGYRSGMSNAEIAELAEIDALIRAATPVSANAHTADANHPANVLASWFVTAHVNSTPLVFRTRVESPVL